MKNVRTEDGIVVEILPESTYEKGIEFWYGKDFALQCIEAEDDVKIGWEYNKLLSIFNPLAPSKLNPSQLRKAEYSKKKCILWEDTMLTIDEANVIYLAYIAEENVTKSTAIQLLIIEQKTIIRTKFPDME